MIQNPNTIRPCVSIVVPVYNAEANLDRCIEHIICQTYKNIEVILVNDGSTDSSKEVCLKWVEKDGRIRLINQGNRGPSSARNAGYKESSGKWIWFVDSDDSIVPEAVEMLVTEADKHSSDVAVCNFEVIEGDRLFGRGRVGLHSFPLIGEADPECYLEDLLSRSVGNYIWQFLINRSVIESMDGAPFDEELTLYEDVVFSLKLALAANRFAYVSHICYLYHMTEGSLVHTRSSRVARRSLRAVEFLEGFPVPERLMVQKLECYLTLLLGAGVAAGTGPDAVELHSLIKQRIVSLRNDNNYRFLTIRTKIKCILVIGGLYWKLCA